ncbi:MAG: SDR family oxidoreductase [SAR202 cluster bacterium]|nr:SDR family oxidoreductase [SAR202 cluster bacterium]
MAERVLDGKVAIVTGAGRGIGKAIAILMAQHGAKIVVNDLGVSMDGSDPSRRPADDTVSAIIEDGGSAVANYASVVGIESAESIIQEALDTYGRLDILANPAGILRDRMIFNMTEQEWDEVIRVHLTGHFSLIKPVSTIFRKQGAGSIITFSSTSGLIGNAGQANYGAAKDGVAGLTRVVARDLGRYGVRCNCISPGADTRMTASVPQSVRTARRQRSTPGVSELPQLELERPPEAVAPVAVWLASDEARDINGQIFHVSGGQVGVMTQPEPMRVIQKSTTGPWALEEIAAIFPSTLGLDMVNPSPPAS